MRAAEARKRAKAYMDKVGRDHDREYNRLMAEEKRESEALWEKRSPALIKQINGYIETASAEGDHHTYAPSDVNPNGDQIIYLEDGDHGIHDMLMKYFRAQGYTVEEYQYHGMKITW
jgi:hypothetical protein